MKRKYVGFRMNNVKCCPECGTEIMHNHTYCKNCGINLKYIEKKKSTIINNKTQVSDEKLKLQGFKRCPGCGHKLKITTELCPFCEDIPFKSKNGWTNGVQKIIHELKIEEKNKNKKYCKECGAEILHNVHYCTTCGINLEPITPKNTIEKNEISKQNKPAVSFNKNSEKKKPLSKNMKTCPNCGKKTDPYSPNCIYCGTTQPSYFLSNKPNQKSTVKQIIRKSTKNKPIKTKSTKKDHISIREFIKLYIKSTIREKTIITLEFLLLLFLIVAVPPLGLSIAAIGIICYLANRLDLIKL